MKEVIRHDLSFEEAREVTRKALDAYKKRFDSTEPTFEWTKPHACTMEHMVDGNELTAEIELRDQSIILNLNVPEEYAPFKGKQNTLIEEEIRESLRAR